MRSIRFALPSSLFVLTAFLLSLAATIRLSPSHGGDDSPKSPPTVTAADGRRLTLDAPRGGALVLVFLSTECPISNAYSPTLNQVAGVFSSRPGALVGLCVDPDLSAAKLAAHAKEYALKFPVAIDQKRALADRFGVKVTPEVVVLDETGKVRYQGRIDDQYAARQKRNLNPQKHELDDAVNAILSGKPVPTPKAEAVGCPLPEWNPAKASVTYTRDVAGLLQKHCQECHRPGQIGPFSLLTYKDAAKRADDIAAIVDSRKMPPWKPAPGVGPKYKHDRSLSASEIATFTAWADAGAPEGDPADLPPASHFSDDWTLGTPDLVLEPNEDLQIPASGDDIYRCFVIPTDLPEDKYIAAIEYRPGNRRIVHHVLSYVDISGQARERDKQDPGPGYMCFSGPGIEVHGDLGGWAPGNEPARLPEGIGRALPKKADVVMQVHYHPDGKPETDRTKIGLYFATKKVKQTLHWALAGKFDLVIPKDDANFKAVAYPWKLPLDVYAHAVTPHMHMLGKDMSVSVTYPDGRVEQLVKIPDWDFGWQNTYYFQKPIFLPAGTVLNVDAHYDNSASNPRNPNHPPKDVKWGEATTDEMCIGFLAITKANQDLTREGEVDDLRKIIDQSYDEQLKQLKDKKGRESGRAGLRSER